MSEPYSPLDHASTFQGEVANGASPQNGQPLYFYCYDGDFGPFFLKFCSYLPYNAKLCVNRHHWAQQQAAKAGIGFTAMDNAFAAVDDVAALQAICDSFGPGHIQALLDKWMARLPHPFIADDRAAGFDYSILILQAEFS